MTKQLRKDLEPAKGLIQQRGNRPDIRNQIPVGVMFHAEGSTGWGRRRDLGGYKGAKREADFADQHGRFFDATADEQE